MADEDEDEDVDLEHTALFKYMQEQGLLEHTQFEEVHGQAKTEKTTASFWMRILDAVLKVPSMLLSYIRSELLMNPAINSLEDYYLEQYRKVIFNCRALTEDDANYLENLLDPFDQLSSAMLTTIHTYFGWHLKTIFVPVLLLTAYCCAKLKTGFRMSNIATTISEGIFVSALVAYVILKLSSQLIVWRKNKTLGKSLIQVTNLVHESECFLKSARNCLNYIKELEVVGRGLILTTAGTSVSKMEQSTLFPRLQTLPRACLCTHLRVCLFSMLKEKRGAIKIATMQLIDSYPLRKEIDNGHYIANMTDQELGVLTSDISKENISISNEGLSVSEIKDIGQLFSVHLSEFLRRLALCFCSEFVAQSNSLHVDDCFIIISPIITSLCLSLTDASKILDDCLKVHRKINREKKSAFPKENASVIHSIMSSQKALLTAIKSLSLHLQVSMARMDDFTEVLENVDAICKCTVANHANEHRLNPDVYRSLNDQLELIKQDLQACNLCWEESSLRLQKLNPNQENCRDLQIPVMVSNENPTDGQSGIPLLEKTDIAPEDQIFEAYVDESVEPNTDEDCYWDLELRKKSAEERNISKRMFTELKTVLVPKVKEWHKREALALRVGNITEDSPTSTTNTHLFDEIKNQPTESTLSVHNENTDVRSKIQEIEPMMPLFSEFNSSIASMAAARSRLLPPAPCETFGSVGDEYYDSDTSSDT